MTTIATGGFSTHDASIGHFNNAWIDYCVARMIVGALPFLLYLKTLQGDWTALGSDTRVMVSDHCGGHYFSDRGLVFDGAGVADPRSLELAAFNIVSIITGTGYATADYGLWGCVRNPFSSSSCSLVDVPVRRHVDQGPEFKSFTLPRDHRPTTNAAERRVYTLLQPTASQMTSSCPSLGSSSCGSFRSASWP